MLAPTGKAAYNIKGNTIHSALAIPACQSLKNYKHLHSSRLNTIRCELGGLNLILLDEVSITVAHIRNAQQYLYRSLQSFTVRNSGLQCTITFF